MNDKPGEACGVAAAWTVDRRATAEVADLVRTMLIALQHRGREAAGIVVVREGRLVERRAPGEVLDVFADRTDLPVGDGAIGHVRYSTSGDRARAQPILITDERATVVLAHNGTLIDLPLSAEPDSEVLTRSLHAVMAGRGLSLRAAIHEVLPTVVGAYSLALSDGEHLYAARDPHGFRPLCLGRRDGIWLLASESAAIAAAGGVVVREVERGELVEIGEHCVSDRLPVPEVPPAACLFEYVYFARADSRFAGRAVYEARYRAGAALADEAPPPPDSVVVAVPETARVAADGYARRAGVPVVQGLLRNPGIGRSFVLNDQAARQDAVRSKLAAVPATVAGRTVVLVDDSLVRGTTMTVLVTMLREAGARQVHVRVASPPYRWPCFYGIDTGRRDELLAAQVDPAALAARLGCDGIAFLPLDRLVAAVGGTPDSYCTACMTGRYPTAVPDVPGLPEAS
jgi:amidophosphoribosyltransferase